MASNVPFRMLDFVQGRIGAFSRRTISLVSETVCIAYERHGIGSIGLAVMGWLWSESLPAKEYSGVTPGGYGSGNLPTIRASNPIALAIVLKIETMLQQVLVLVVLRHRSRLTAKLLRWLRSPTRLNQLDGVTGAKWWQESSRS